MPRVPTYDQPQEQVRALPGVRQDSVASPGLFDAGAQQQMQIGQSMQVAGGDLMKVATQMQDRENVDKVFQQLTTAKNKYLDFEKQARERRGDAAKDVTKDAADWWDKALLEGSDALANDVQRRAYRAQLQGLRLQSLDNLASYESAQRRESLNQSAAASVVGSINLAASQVGTPTEKAAITGAREDIVKHTLVQKQLNGWSEELYQAKLAQYLTDFHLQIIQNKVDKDPAGARQYFELNKAEINGTQYDRVDKVLKLGGLKETAQTFADQVETAGMSEADALKAAREKFSGEEEDAVTHEIKTRFAEQAVARERSQRTAADSVYGMVARGTPLSAVPTSLLAQMDGKDLFALRKTLQQAAEGKLPKTDWDKYYDLRKQALNDPEAFVKRDLRREFPYLARAEREGLIDLQTKAKNAKELKDAATLENQLGNMHDLLGFGAGDKEKKGLFDREVTNAIDAEERARGKKLTYQERQQIMDRMIIEGQIDGSGWFRDDRGRVYELQDREDFRNFVPSDPEKFFGYVPRAERDKIEAALKRAGLPVNDAAVLELYKRKFRR